MMDTDEVSSRLDKTTLNQENQGKVLTTPATSTSTRKAWIRSSTGTYGTSSAFPKRKASGK